MICVIKLPSSVQATLHRALPVYALPIRRSWSKIYNSTLSDKWKLIVSDLAYSGKLLFWYNCHLPQACHLLQLGYLVHHGACEGYVEGEIRLNKEGKGGSSLRNLELRACMQTSLDTFSAFSQRSSMCWTSVSFCAPCRAMRLCGRTMRTSTPGECTTGYM